MDERYIALATPIFFLLIGFELLVNYRQGKLRYRFHDSITNLSCGIGEQAISPFLRVVSLAGYAWVYERFALLSISSGSVAAWIVLLLGVDVAYYWFHRASHRVNFLWAAHAVHHQSEEMNLSVALRQSWFGKLFEWVFYLPLALFGFPPLMFLSMTTLNTLYQFWIHTGAIDRVGVAETTLNTPSHHRVHHGINPRYIDRNYAGVLIVWDKLFGTFEPESEPVVYGTVKPLASWNPLWANVQVWVQLATMATATRSWRDSVKLWFMPPEWRPADLGGKVVIPEVTPGGRRKYEHRVPLPVDLYVAANFALVIVATTGILLFGHLLTSWQLGVTAGLVIATLVVWGGLFEERRWAPPTEVVRLAAVVWCVLWVAARVYA